MLLALLVALNDPAPASCPLPFPVAVEEGTALAIAKFVIAAAPRAPLPKDIAGYRLKARYVPTSRSWEVMQEPISAVKAIRFLDGEGLSMEIAACDGAVSNIRLNRAPLAKTPEAYAR